MGGSDRLPCRPSLNWTGLRQLSGFREKLPRILSFCEDFFLVKVFSHAFKISHIFYRTLRKFSFNFGSNATQYSFDLKVNIVYFYLKRIEGYLQKQFVKHFCVSRTELTGFYDQ